MVQGCSVVHHYLGESCKTRSFIRTPLRDHLSSRFGDGQPVRMGVIPLSVPENIAGRSDNMPGVGVKLASLIQSSALEYKTIPIIEVLNRDDWPAKRDEFFKGSFGALQTARAAGYDLIWVGLVDHSDAIDKVRVFSKIIEVDGGLTLWYGKAEAEGLRDDLDHLNPFTKSRPDKFSLIPLYDTVADCIVKEAFRTDPVEE